MVKNVRKMTGSVLLATALFVVGLALAACLTIGSVQAADQGERPHARGEYDSATATYVVAEGDDLTAISERFEVTVDALKAQNKLSRTRSRSAINWPLALLLDSWPLLPPVARNR